MARGTLEATTETIGPRLLAMICILAMFTPALFMTGVAKAMFLPLSLAVGFSMIASYLLSSTLVPILVVLMERRSRKLPAHESPDGHFARFRNHIDANGIKAASWFALTSIGVLRSSAISCSSASFQRSRYWRASSGVMELK